MKKLLTFLLFGGLALAQVSITGTAQLAGVVGATAVVAGGMNTQTASDDFPGGDGAASGWTTAMTGGNCNIYQHHFYTGGSVANDAQLCYYSGSFSPPLNSIAHGSRATIHGISSSYNALGPAVMISASGGYFVGGHDNTQATLYRIDATAGVPSAPPVALCGTDSSPYTIAADDIIELDASGGVLTVKRISGTPVTLGTCSDSTHTSGTPGAGGWASSTGQLDAWKAFQ